MKYDDIVQIEAMFFEKTDIQEYIINIVTADTDVVKFHTVASAKRESLEEKFFMRHLIALMKLSDQEDILSGI